MSRATSITTEDYQRLKRAKQNVFRFYLLFGLFLLIALMVAGKLLYIQVWDAGNLKHKAQQFRSHNNVLYNRGRILDRNGVILAQDNFLYDLYAHPVYYREASAKQLATALAPILDQPLDKLTEKLSRPDFTISVAKNLEKAVVDRIQAARLRVTVMNPKTKQPLRDDKGQVVTKQIPVPGLDFFKKPVRKYPQGSLAAHILGYINDEAGLSSGIEESAKETLKTPPLGFSQTEAAEFDGKGNMVNLDKVDPASIAEIPTAKDITLTINAKLQYIAERELAAGLARTKAKRGTVIMMDPRNGEILAFAALPTYFPEQYFKASAESLKNWALSDVYPPGSTFKILTIASGLEAGVINRNSKIEDTGRMSVGGWTIQNYDYGKHGAPGLIDLVYLFLHSSNIGSAKISMMIPPEKHWELLKRFGMGSKTGIDLPGESNGILNTPNHWDQATHANIGFGYALAATPMQMASAVAAIANQGIWTTPHVIKQPVPVLATSAKKNAVKNNPLNLQAFGQTFWTGNAKSSASTQQPKIEVRRVVSKQTAQTVTELLQKSIDSNKGNIVRLDAFHVAGKTGTSRKPSDSGRGYSSQLYTSFVGYFPAEAPKVLVMVVVDSPGIGEAWGNTVAAPIFRAIVDQSIGYLGLQPTRMTHTQSSFNQT